MRSRWSAYTVGDVEYILDTTDPSGAQFRPDREAWAAEVRRFCERTRFEKLEIRAVGPVVDGVEGARGEVEFFAKLSRDGQDVSFCERSSFTRSGGRWRYLDGVHVPV